MLSDRSYMRESYGRPGTSVLTWLICLIVAGFIIQNVFLRWFGGGVGASFEHAFELSVEGLRSGQIWTLLSYSLLHSPTQFLHIIANLLGLYFLGRELLPYLGSRRFLGLFFGAVFLGGLAWSATHWSGGGAVVGASAGVLGLLIVFACMNPNQPITLLLFFILPVTLKPKWIAVGVLGIDLCGFLFYELGGSSLFSSYAHSAHLGGMAAGWLFFQFVYRRDLASPDRAPSIELPKWLRRTRKISAPEQPVYRVNVEPPPSREDLRAEVDRILDKINSQGFGALTPDEKRRLDEAKNLLSRR